MTSRYRFDPRQSRFTARASAAGFLSLLGHSPTFAVNDFAGAVMFMDDLIANLQLELAVRADGLLGVGPTNSPDHREIEDRARSGETEMTAGPEITFRAATTATDRLAPGHYRLVLGGTLALRGITRPHQLLTELLMFQNGLRLKGETGLCVSEFGIQPISALGGTIRFQDEVKLAFDLAARPEPA